MDQTRLEILFILCAYGAPLFAGMMFGAWLADRLWPITRRLMLAREYEETMRRR